jgi:hypothetical protein
MDTGKGLIYCVTFKNNFVYLEKQLPLPLSTGLLRAKSVRVDQRLVTV